MILKNFHDATSEADGERIQKKKKGNGSICFCISEQMGMRVQSML